MNDRTPRISFVLATHNRREVVTRTLSQLAACGLDRSDYEIIVVDNASADGTPEAARSYADSVLRLRRNLGSCAKALGVDRARGECIVFLDDDSFPRPGSIPRMIEHFGADPKLGAAGFTVHLPDGRLEGGALPGVFLGCGVAFRAGALRGVGGLDRTFFMQAEEYDLSFRLVSAGWRIDVFDDLHVDHLKTAQARKTDRTTYLDVRNNLRIAARYLPSPCFKIYREDLLQRYGWLAERDGHLHAHRRGARRGRLLGAVERWTYRRHRLTPSSFEYFYRWDEVRRRMAALSGAGVKRIIFADLGKNVYAFHQAATREGINVVAIGDDRFHAVGRRYRGTPIVAFDEALGTDHDAVVVANTSKVHGGLTYHRVIAQHARPAHFWFGTVPQLRTAPLYTKCQGSVREGMEPMVSPVAAPPCAVGGRTGYRDFSGLVASDGQESPGKLRDSDATAK